MMCVYRLDKYQTRKKTACYIGVAVVPRESGDDSRMDGLRLVPCVSGDGFKLLNKQKSAPKKALLLF